MLDPNALHIIRPIVVALGIAFFAWFVWMFICFYVADRRRYRR